MRSAIHPKPVYPVEEYEQDLAAPHLTAMNKTSPKSSLVFMAIVSGSVLLGVAMGMLATEVITEYNAQRVEALQ